jgi:hypothetical protein
MAPINYYVMLCYVMLCYVMLCYVMLRYVMKFIAKHHFQDYKLFCSKDYKTINSGNESKDCMDLKYSES